MNINVTVNSGLSITATPQCSRNYIVGTIPVIQQSGTSSASQLWVDANYYPRTNPSGYITGQIIRPEDTGIFYTNDNPSGFITGVDLSNYVIKNDTGDFITSSQTGSFSNADTLDSFHSFYFVNTGETGQFSPSGHVHFETGDFVLKDETGIFYLNNNPSGYITGVDLSSYVTTGETGHSHPQYALNSDTGNFIINDQTGNFYAATNPSGFITGVDLSNYVMDNETGNFITSFQTGNFAPAIHSHGQYALSADTGNFITSNQTGQFYPTNNPSGFVTGSVVRPNETGNFVTLSQTGNFAPIIHTHGQYALSADTGNFVTTNQTGVFSNADTLDNFHASYFINTGQTGAFYSSLNPSGFITGVDLSNYVIKNDTGNFVTTGDSRTLGFLGNVGVGASVINPYGSANNPKTLQINSTTTYAELKLTNVTTTNSENAGLVLLSNGLNGFLINANTGSLNFYTTNASRLSITSSGDVGIGTTLPATKLHIVGATRFGATNPSYYLDLQPTYIGPGNGFRYDFNITDVAGETSAFPALSIYQNGNVGVGTTNPTHGFSVSGDVRIDGWATINGNVYGDNNLVLDSDTGNFITTSQTGIFSNADTLDTYHSSYFINTGQTGDFVKTIDSRNLEFTGFNSFDSFVQHRKNISFYPNIISSIGPFSMGGWIFNTPVPRTGSYGFSARVHGSVASKAVNFVLFGTCSPNFSGNIDGQSGAIVNYSISDAGKDTYNKYVGVNSQGNVSLAIGDPGSYLLYTRLSVDFLLYTNDIATVQEIPKYPTGWSWEINQNTDFFWKDKKQVVGDLVRTGQTGIFSNADTLDSYHSSYFVNTGQSGQFASASHTHPESGLFALSSQTGDFVTTGDNRTLFFGGSVSVGTANPTDKFSVSGTMRVDGGMLFNGTVSGNNNLVLDSETGNFVVSTGVGTNNYFPKWSNNTLTNTSSIIDVGGNVGIGTTAPNSKLEIVDVNKSTALTYNLGVMTSDAKDVNVGGKLSLGGKYLDGNDSFAPYGSIVGRKENATNGDGDGYLALLTSNSDAVPFEKEHLRVTSAGNVGIGTTTPGDKLTVKKEAESSVGATFINGIGIASEQSIVLNAFADNTSGARIRAYGNYGATWRQGIALQYRDTNNNLLDGLNLNGYGYIGIGTTGPQAKLDVLNADSTAGNIFISNTYNNRGIQFGTTATSAYIQADADSHVTPYLLSINPNGGNVGIGTTTPATKLHTIGRGIFQSDDDSPNEDIAQLIIRGNTTTSKQLLIGYNTSSNYAYLQAANWGIEYSPLILNQYGGFVGIGTTSPSVLLSLGASIGHKVALYEASNGSSKYGFGIQSDLFEFITPANGPDFTFGYGTSGALTRLMTIKGVTGNVGIGTTNPSTKLEVNGTITCTSIIGNHPLKIAAKTSNYVATTADEMITCTGTISITLPASTGGGFQLWIKNRGTGEVSVIPNGTETIDGVAGTMVLRPKDCLHLCDLSSGDWGIL